MNVIYRPASPEDALSISVLATQIFLDTYATGGMRADLAQEALGIYNVPQLATRIASLPPQFIVAECNAHLVAFTEIVIADAAPLPALSGGLECKKLYVQRHFKRMGIGQQLLQHAEASAKQSTAPCVWLTAYIKNYDAINFYEAMGYVDVARVPYVFEGNSYENIVFSKIICL